MSEVVVRQGRAVGIRTASGHALPARRAVLADVSARSLYGSLVAAEHLPDRLLDDMLRFQWDFAMFKVDWALNAPVPWDSPAAATAGTVHLAEGVDELSRWASRIARGLIPDRPFLLFGQMTTADATRSPRGTESAWAYTHVPHSVKADAGADGLSGAWDRAEQQRMADRGAAMHQQLVFRPVPGTGRPETPVKGLYLASAAAHPGGGVHGAPGANAARAALRSTRATAIVLSTAQRMMSRRGRGGET